MSTDANPYQSPPEIIPTETANQPEGRFWSILFWGAVGLTGVGSLAMFTRNLPALGFLLAAGVLFVITMIGSNRNRKRSIIGFVLCLLTAVFVFYQLRLMQARIARDRAMRAQSAAYEAAMAAEQAAVSEYERLMEMAETPDSNE